ncbi:MAG TPA: hypothetical protein VFQ25_07060 [Ktedonobacterales bacterium]|nr:hypothetical protein [Ktedonobacterales bacterium]
MASIYLSYRPGDNDAVAGRLYDQLAERFGRDAVIRRAPGDAPERPAIEADQRDAVVVVALIGPRWLRGASNEHAPLTREDDPVRLELEVAMRRRLPVIPALTQGAAMPQAPYLPESLRALAALPPALVRDDPDFRRDVERLMVALGRYVAPLAAARGVRGISTAAFALLAATALLLIALSAAGVVFAARAGVGPFSPRATAISVTATPTPIITRTPTLVTVMSDPLTTLVDYGSVDNTWIVNSAIGTCGFANGGYQVIGSSTAKHITICAGPQAAAAGDQRISVTTRLTKASDSRAMYGLFFRASDQSATDGYDFFITPSGRWLLVNEASGKVLISGASRAIHTGVGAVNTLTVDAYGPDITLSVNGTRMGHVTDHAFAAGQLGFLVEHGLVAVYTKFTLQRYQ